MAYYYVKSGGTATGDNGRTATQRTGTWNASTADYYNDLYDLQATVTTAAVDGDVICIAHTHAYTGAYTDHVTLNSTGSVSGVGLLVVSVDNANQENYLPGASEYNTSLNKLIQPKYNVHIAGVSIASQDDALLCNLSGTNLYLQDLTLHATSSSDACLKMIIDGCTARLVNVILSCGNTGSEYFSANAGSLIIWEGGSVTGSSPGDLFDSSGNGGLTYNLTGVDLTGFTGKLMGSLTAGISDVCNLTLNNCLLDDSVVMPVTPSAQQRFEMWNTDDSTDIYHRFLVQDGSGAAVNNDSVYVTGNQPWYEGAVKSSIAITTTAQCSKATPFVFEIPARYVDLSSTSTDKITVNLVTDATLTDTQIAAFLVYPDGITAVQGNWLTSGTTVGAGNYGVDPLSAGTELSTSALGAADWTGEPASPNFYKMELDTSTDAGQATAVSVRIEVYYDFTTAGDVLYIDPILEVGT